jgi:hypothetical protein
MPKAVRTAFTCRPSGTLSAVGGLSLSGALIAYIFFRREISDSSFGWVSLLAIPFLVLYWRDKFRIRDSQVLTQADRHRFAQAVYENVKGGESQDEFALYLRPFFSDARFVWLPGSLGDKSWKWGGGIYFENAFCEAIDRHAPLIQVGGDGNRFGPGIVRVADNEWKSAVIALAARARLIIVVPFSQPATSWEIQTMKEMGFLSKVIFVVPPYSRLWGQNSNKVDPNTRGLREIYLKSKSEFSEAGLSFPDEFGAGALRRFAGAFTLTDNGTVRDVVPFIGDAEMEPIKLQRTLLKLVQHIASTPPAPSRRALPVEPARMAEIGNKAAISKIASEIENDREKFVRLGIFSIVAGVVGLGVMVWGGAAAVTIGYLMMMSGLMIFPCVLFLLSGLGKRAILMRHSKTISDSGISMLEIASEGLRLRTARSPRKLT